MRLQKLSFAAVLLAALAVVGCAAPSGSDAPIVEGDPTPGGTLRLTIAEDPPHLNYDILSQPAVGQTVPLWAEQLLEHDQEGNLEGRLAESWEISDDGLEYTFNLRDGVTWHDGEPFTADDVVYTLQTTMPLNPRTAGGWEKVTAIEASDDMTVRMTLSEPYAPMLPLLSGNLIYMLPAHLYAGTDILDNPANAEPVGTGPYKFESWDRGQQIGFTRNPDYWQTDRPYFDGVTLKIITSEATATNALKNNEIDYIAGDFSVAASMDFRAQPSLVEREQIGIPTQTVMGFNTLDGAMADVDARHAIVQALNRQQIVDIVYPGAAPALSVIPEHFVQLTDETHTYDDSFPYDPDAAAEALKEAGVTNLDLLIPAEQRLLDTANVVKAQLADVGVDVNVLQMDEQSHADRVYSKGEYDLYISSYTADVDPAIGVERLYSCETVGQIYGNATGYCNDDVQAAFGRARTMTDVSDRQAAYAEATQQILEDMPRLAITNYAGSAFVTDRLGGIEEEFRLGDGRYADWIDAWLIQ